MCCKLMKKCCCLVVIAMIAGAVFYFLCGLKGDDMYEEGSFGKKMQDKKKKVKQACGCMKEQGEDIAKELKFLRHRRISFFFVLKICLYKDEIFKCHGKAK